MSEILRSPCIIFVDPQCSPGGPVEWASSFNGGAEAWACGMLQGQSAGARAELKPGSLDLQLKPPRPLGDVGRSALSGAVPAVAPGQALSPGP